MNDFGLLVGEYNASLPSLVSGEKNELQLDINGRLIIAGQWFEDDAHVSGDAGLFALGVRDDGTLAEETVGPNTFTAVSRGTIGNSISLVFDGIDDVTTVVNAWNVANPNNMVSFTGSGATVPSAQTVNLSGAENNSIWTSDHGDYSPISVDKYGRMQVIAAVSIEPSDAEFSEDSPNSSGDVGLHVLTVRQDVLAISTSADGDYADFKVNDLGELYVHDTDVLAQLVLIKGDTATIASDTTSIDATLTALSKLEDAAHSSGDAGIQALAVRQDTLANSTDADGDYGSLKLNVKGELYVTDTDSIAELVLANASLDNIELYLLNQQHAEDSAHISGDIGSFALAVRNDAEASLVDTDGDYAPLQVNSIGRLKVDANISDSIPGSFEYNATDDLAAAADGLISGISGTYTTLVSRAVGAGETAYIYGYQADMDVNGDIRLISDDGSDIITYKVRLNSSAMPGVSEHFSNEGRIEIAGSATTFIRIQGRKRGVGGNGNGSASLHIRIV